MNFKKINQRVNDMFEKGEFDYDFIDIKISKINLEKLHNYQILHVYNLISCLKKNGVVVDGSSTGTGKTFTSLCVCSEAKLEPLIICPKSIVDIWRSTCDYFNVQPLAIVNYETMRTGQMYDENGKRITCPFLTATKGKGSSINYTWNLANKNRNIIIFDEAHRCKNKKSQNGQLLLSSKNVCKILLLSATLSDSIENFALFGYMLGFYSSIQRGRNWTASVIREDKNRLIEEGTSTLNKYIFPDKGSRMNIEDLGDKFPKNNIFSDCYTISSKSKREINNLYENIRELYKGRDGLELVTINKLRQKIEFLKSPILYDQAEKYLDNGKSVAIFVNFTDTLNDLSEQFKKAGIEHCMIHGKQDTAEREREITKFQTNMVKVILCMMQSGSTGISLHDTSGHHSRVSLISPSFSSTDLIQTLGRIFRIGIVQPVIQKLVYCADTYEQELCKRVKGKLKFINYLSDEDLIGF